MGLVSSNIFRQVDAPRYIPALVTTAAFGGMGIVLTIGLGAWMGWDNARRDRKEGVVRTAGGEGGLPTELLKEGPAVEGFRWYL